MSKWKSESCCKIVVTTVFFVLCISLVAAHSRVISLNGDDWTFYNSNQSVNGQATVPGNIYRDLANNGIIASNLFGEHQDQLNRWIGYENWTFSRTFSFNAEDLAHEQIFLVAHALDTVAEVRVNGKVVAISRNMFTRLRVQINRQVVAGNNQLDVLFLSPVLYAAFKSAHYRNKTKYTVPPVCPHSEQKGECHVNFVRKMQCSFSWDWGPTFASSGIVRDIELHIGSGARIRHVMVSTKKLDYLGEYGKQTVVKNATYQSCSQHLQCPLHQWALKVKLLFDSFDQSQTWLKARFRLNQHLLNEPLQQFPILLRPSLKGETSVTFNLFTPSYHQILPWYPNGIDYLHESNDYFKPNLYRLTVELLHPEDTSVVLQQTSVRVGFREIELIQDSLETGLSFYFRVNQLPVYMRGTNYIPSTLSVGVERLEKERIASLLYETKKANMNMIRVWGGGVYESDYFYDLADSYGILIWQDMMFAVALYSVDQDTIVLIAEELKQQVERLQHHPSIALWAGNNENEVAISQFWWPEVLLFLERLKQDYVHLYVEVLRPIIRRLDPDRPFLLSSPSNAKASEQMGLFKDPQNPNYGDVHFYDYSPDCFNDSKYPNAKFVSEYGFQAYPSLQTMAQALLPENLVWPIRPVVAERQHAPLGNQNLLDQIQFNFEWNSSAPSKEISSYNQFSEFVYLSQVIQSMAIKLESEFYIRNRQYGWWNQPDNAQAVKNITQISRLTMGSLYWQLNDVWQAPTWSSVDFNGTYKLLHHQVLRFFRPLHVIAFRQNSFLGIALINDCIQAVQFKVQVCVYPFAPLSEAGPIVVKEFQAAVQRLNVRTEHFDLDQLLIKAGCRSEANCAFRVKFVADVQPNAGNAVYEQRIETRPNTWMMAGEDQDLNAQSIGLVKEGENFLLLDRPRNLRLIGAQVSATFTEWFHVLNPSHKFGYVLQLITDAPALFVGLDFMVGSHILGEFSDNGFIQFDAQKRIYFYTTEFHSLGQLNENLVLHKYN